MNWKINKWNGEISRLHFLSKAISQEEIENVFKLIYIDEVELEKQECFLTQFMRPTLT